MSPSPRMAGIHAERQDTKRGMFAVFPKSLFRPFLTPSCGRGLADDGSPSQMDAADTACFAWGQNEHGALCLPSVQDEPQPCRVLALRSQFVRAVGASRAFSVAASATNTLLWWGAAGDGLPRPTEGAPLC